MAKTILFCITNYPETDRRMIRVCKTLSENQWDVTLVGRKLKSGQDIPDFPFKVKRLNTLFKRGILFYLEYNIRLVLVLITAKARIYGSVDYDTLLGVIWGAGLRRKKVVFDAHEWFEELPELEGKSFKKWVWSRIAKWGLPKVDYCYTVSMGIGDRLHEKYGVSFDVLHNYPPLEKEEPSAIRDNIILYLGALNKGRGLEEVIKVMHRIDAILWLVGEGDLSKSLRTLVTQEKLNHKVIFHGLIPPDQILEYLLKARVGLNLLDSHSKSYKYSLANKFFDYVHAGMPQLCMDFPEYRRFNQQFDVANLIKDLNPESIYYALNHLLEDRNYWFTYHITCLEARKAWSWDQEQLKLLDGLEKMDK
jgi:glycosyltransferase involved in cell wall biosynthesis